MNHQNIRITLFLLVFAFIGNHAFSQLYAPTATPSTNNYVGIGTGVGTPQALLDIKSHNSQQTNSLLRIKHPEIYSFGGTPTSALLIQGTDINNNVNTHFQVNNSGYVSIGTDDAALGYLLSVKGKIMAEEVRVMLQANWPDYVFTQDYPLLQLSQVESFIKENGHLPEIPSAAVVQENGLDLGEMDAKLLRKIEELTLYMIELEKRNTDLESRLLNLENQ